MGLAESFLNRSPAGSGGLGKLCSQPGRQHFPPWSYCLWGDSENSRSFLMPHWLTLIGGLGW